MKVCYMALLLVLILPSLAFSLDRQNAKSLADLFEKKTNAHKSDVFGRKIKTQLQQTGDGVTREQEQFVWQQIIFAIKACGENLICNAKFVGQKIEDKLSGRWNV